MEGVLFNVRQCYDELCRIGGVPQKIKLSGGIANSKVWTQMCCDIFGREMELSPQQQASLMGGAYLAVKCLGGSSNSISPIQGQGRIVKPDPGKAELYRERFEKYKKWYRATNPK
jgi:gluconokinase